MSATLSSRGVGALADFVGTSLDSALADADDEAAARTGALELFHATAREVPAYAAFLAEQGIEPDAIRSFTDFERLPLITKQNYLTRHPLAELCRGGQLAACDMVAVSSGSTGQPTFWPRSLVDELPIARRFEQVFHDSFRADERRTLAVVCFALGTWVGGMFTAACCRWLATRGYPITVITPGNNMAEILRVVQRLAPDFDQTVLLGYPPFLKDVIDTGLAQGVAWARYAPKLVMAGEVFSEEWRTLVGQRSGSTQVCFDSASLYGTADAGVLGNETPLSVCIRRYLAEQPQLARTIFGESRLLDLVGQYGFDPLAELRTVSDRGVRPLPFAYVFGRADFTISYFGANVFPENVTVGLEQAPIDERQQPRIELAVQGDADYFPVGVKHRYTRRSP